MTNVIPIPRPVLELKFECTQATFDSMVKRAQQCAAIDQSIEFHFTVIAPDRSSFTVSSASTSNLETKTESIAEGKGFFHNLISFLAGFFGVKYDR